VNYADFLAKPQMVNQYETPTVVYSELGQILYLWPTVSERTIRIGLKGTTHVKLTYKLDPIGYSCNFVRSVPNFPRSCCYRDFPYVRCLIDQ
jgi:hypothetical protein